MGLAARVITVSDRCARDEAEDRSGPLALSLLAGHGISADLALVPDDIPAIRAAIRSACEAGARLVLTTGGTGVSPVRGVIEALSGFENAKQKYVIAGFRSPEDMLFRDDLANWKNKLNLTLTVDGAPEGYEGNIGLVTKYIPELPLADPAKAKAVVVGPPAMMKFSIIELLKKGFREENITVSYERKMCCGLGKCGHCRVSDTYICLDGPVFNYVDAKQMVD